MKKDRKYIIFLSLAVIVYLTVKTLAPREFDWRVTFHPDDRNPYGAYAISELMNGIFPAGKIHRSNYTAYEIYDSLQRPGNLLSFSMQFGAQKADVIALLDNVSKGGNAFIAAESFGRELEDTLNLSTRDYFFFDHNVDQIFNREDTSSIVFKNPALGPAEKFRFPRKNVHDYFFEFDSSRSTIIAVNDLKLPVLINMKWGKGNLYLSSTPMAFTNIHLMEEKNTGFAERALSYIPEDDLQWTAFYQLGRMEANSPLRFILTTPSLAWAYYIIIGSIILFMAFEIKRRQRIIPIVKPPANTTLEFVATVGDLYYHNGDHKNIAEKKIAFFLEQVRSKYLLNTSVFDETFLKTLAKKSGNAKEDVEGLFRAISNIQSKASISPVDLMALNMRLEKFNNTNK